MQNETCNPITQAVKTLPVLLLMLVLFAGVVPTASAHHAWVADEFSANRCCTSAVAADNGYFYVFGGFGCPNDCSDIVRYDPVTKTHVTVANLPSGRHYTSAAFDGNRYAYIFGGSQCTTGCSPTLREIVRFDVDTNQVQVMSGQLPNARGATSAVWANGKAYIIGGWDPNLNRLPDILEYDPSTQNVVLRSTALSQNVYGVASVWTGSLVYMFGGNGHLASGPTTSIRTYDPATNTVNNFAGTLPHTVALAAATWDGTDAYIFGGDSSGGSNAIRKYTPGVGATVLSATLPSGMYPVSGGYMGGGLHIVNGGFGVDDIVHFDPTNVAPVASIGSIGSTVECTGNSKATVPLDGTGSSDFDGDALSYLWTSSTGTIGSPTSASTTGSFSLGSHSVTLDVDDGNDHQDSDAESFSVVDTTAPTTTSNPSGTAGNAGWWRSDVTVNLVADDACDRPTTTSYSVDGGSSQSGTTALISGDGTHSLDYASSDDQGNTESTKTDTIKIDATAPVSTASTSGTSGNSGWFLGPVSVSVGATDFGSGVDGSFCAVDGGATGASPCAASGDGVHDVAYHSTDVAGNVETDQHLDVKIDGTPPSTTAFYSGTSGGGGWWRSSVGVTLSGSDATSGVATTSGAVDSVSQPGSIFTVSGDGTHSVTYSSTDVAGNTEATNTDSLKIDTTAPSTSVSVSGTGGGGGWYTSDATLTFTASDALSGVDQSYCSTDGGAPVAGNPCIVASDGAHTVQYYSTDVAGNQETSKSVSVKVDQTAPVTTASVSGTAGDNGWWRSGVSVTLARSDASSGIDTTEYRLDGGPWQTGILLNIATDGTHTLEFRSTDVAGNVESIQTTFVKIDTGIPTVDLQRPDAGTLYLFDAPQTVPLPVATVVGAITLEATATDPPFGSGMDRVEFLVDGDVVGTDTTPSGTTYSFLWSPGLGDIGTHVVTARAVDVAGNIDSESRQILVVGL